jgi:uncharacterized protein (DUF1330 family)
MSDPKFAHPATAVILCGNTGRHYGAHTEGDLNVRFPDSKRRGASVKAAVACALLAGLAWGTPAIARGGFMHGTGGFGMHGRAGDGHAGGREGFLAPAYVLITVSKITDAEAFKATMRDLVSTTAPFAARLAADMDKPISWNGAPAEHIVLLQFDDLDQAQVWKNSDVFKKFDDDLHRSSESNMQLVQGQPTPVSRGMERGRGGRGNGRLDPKAFEPNVKEYDQMLNKMHGICKGC